MLLFFHLAFLQLDDDQDEDSMQVLQELENIDDECDQQDIAFVKIGKFIIEIYNLQLTFLNFYPKNKKISR